MTKSNFRPLGDRVLIRPDSKSEEKKSKGGLILTDSINRGQKVYGTVVSIGTGIFSQAGQPIPSFLRVGDVVLYKKNESTDTIKVDDEELLIFHEHELLGFIR
jgi:chaperonin GroES